MKKHIIATALLAIASTPVLAETAIYNVNDYGLALEKKEALTIKPFVAIGAFYEKESEGTAYEVQLGLSSVFNKKYSVDTAIYHSKLGVFNKTFENGDFLKLKPKGYGLKTSFNYHSGKKSIWSASVGAGFIYENAEVGIAGASQKIKAEGGQISSGLGYAYQFTEKLSAGIKYEHYFRSVGIGLSENRNLLGGTVKINF